MTSPPREIDRDQMLVLAALTIGMFWVVGSANYQSLHLVSPVLLLAGAGVAALAVRRLPLAGWLALAYVTLIGIVNRSGRRAFNGSDVIGNTRDALVVLFHGGNPYAHPSIHTHPPGAPFPYLPGDLLFYAIPHLTVGQIVGADKWAGVGVVLLLAILSLAVGPAAAALGTAVYATFEPAVLRSLDGSNDTGLAFLVVLAVVLLALAMRTESRPLLYASAVALAWALTFKAFSWPLFPFAVAYLARRGRDWRGFAAVALGLSLAVTIPFFVTAPGAFIHNLVFGMTFHQQPFGLNLWSPFRTEPWVGGLLPLAPICEVAAGLGLTALLLTHPPARLAVVLFQALAVFLGVLLFARYATSSYYTFACAVLAAALALYVGRDSPAV